MLKRLKRGREAGRDDFPQQNGGFSHQSEEAGTLVRNNDMQVLPLQTWNLLYKALMIMLTVSIQYNILQVK